MTILVLVWWVFEAPQDPQNLFWMAQMGGKSCLQVHFESRGEKMTTWKILVAEISVFNPKKAFFFKRGVFKPPQEPQYLPFMSHMDT